MKKPMENFFDFSIAISSKVMYLIKRVKDLYRGILNDDVPKGLFLEHFFMRRGNLPCLMAHT